MANDSGSFKFYIRGAGSKRVRYRIKAVEGPVEGSWAKFFGKLHDKGEPFIIRENIQEDEVLITLTTTNETWSWTESVTNYENTCDFPSTSIYPDTTRYPC